MNKVIASTKQLAITLGFTAIAKNCKRGATADEIFGYICLMCNYMYQHTCITEAQKEVITKGLKVLAVQLDIVTPSSNYSTKIKEAMQQAA